MKSECNVGTANPEGQQALEPHLFRPTPKHQLSQGHLPALIADRHTGSSRPREQLIRNTHEDKLIAHCHVCHETPEDPLHTEHQGADRPPLHSTAPKLHPSTNHWRPWAQPSCGMSVLWQLPVKLEHVTGRASCRALCKWYYFSEAGRILRQPGSRKAGEPQVQGAGRKVEARGEEVVPG